MVGRQAVALLCVALFGCLDDGLAPPEPTATLPDLATPQQVQPDMAWPPHMLTDVPQLASGGGPVLRSPQVVVVLFPGETMEDDIVKMVSTLGATSYWHDTTAEYGIGPIQLKTVVHVAEVPPATIGDTAIQDWLSTRLDGTHPEWPAPDENTVYALFYPSATSIELESEYRSCEAFGGYHADCGITHSDQRVAYAVMPRCVGADPVLTDFQYLTSTVSHELIEAAEDPFPFTDAGFTTVDPEHAVWALFTGGEGADLCYNYLLPDSKPDFQPNDFPYTVQRSWSNAAARAGKDPCVPAEKPGEYFNVEALTPRDPVPDAAFFPAGSTGWAVPRGGSRVVELRLYSEDPALAPWTLSASDTPIFGSSDSAFTYSLDRTSGKQGDIVKLTIRSHATTPTDTDPYALLISSSRDLHSTLWMGVVWAEP